MIVHFNPDSEALPWPGPRKGPSAYAGETWVGPLGFLKILETATGLQGIDETDTARAFTLVKPLQSTEGFWSQSVEADAIGSARALLQWRDTLTLHGWRGEGCGRKRLEELAAVTQGLPPGVPDRLRAILDILPKRDNPIATVELASERKALPKLWQDVLSALEDRNTRIEALTLETTSAEGDLAAARTGPFTPKGDGSLQLVRPQGPLQAAEETASWFAAQESLEDTVVIAPDATLDRALRRHGLPTLGGEGHGSSALLQILPLTLAMGWNPPDPQRALELLTLPQGPVPKSIARRLANSLQRQPAVGGPKWREVLAKGLEDLDEDKRQKAGNRIEALFRSGAPRDAYPPALAIEKADAIRIWLRGMKNEEEDTPYDPPLRQIDEFTKLLELLGGQPLTDKILQRTVRLATQSIESRKPFPAEAGLAAVPGPEALIGSASRIVWWNFLRGTERDARASTLPALSPAERRALAGEDIDLPDSAPEAERIALLWKRAIDCTSRQLLLVCPLTGEDGEPAHPHPLWDQVAASAEPPESLDALEFRVPQSDPRPSRSLRKALPLPEPTTEWSTGTKLHLRDPESPSSIETLIGCPFHWVMHYPAGIKAGMSGRLPSLSMLIGTLIHHVIAQIFREDSKPDPAAARDRAVRIFDEEGPGIAAPLFQPQADAERAQARSAAERAAAALCSLLETEGWSAGRIEEEISAKTPACSLRGFVDLTVGDPEAVIDLKWGLEKYKIEALRNGTALQLAAYARMISAMEAVPMPAVAYLTLMNTTLYTTESERLPTSTRIEGKPPAATWEAAAATMKDIKQDLGGGRIRARIPTLEEAQSKEDFGGITEEGRLRLSNPCRFCDYDALCGYRWGYAHG